MSLLSTILEFTAGSGLTTVVSTAAGAVMKYKERQLEMAHQIALIPHQEKKLAVSIKLHRMQADADRDAGERELRGELVESEAELMDTAMQADRSDVALTVTMDGMPWQVGAIRTLFRPFLTLSLWLAVVVILWVEPESSGYMDVVVAAITNGAVASLGLWFGSRMMSDHRSNVGHQAWTP